MRRPRRPRPSSMNRSHARRRGAVMVEGLIVATVLALLLACGVFFHQLYSAKLKTMREARMEAWRTALTGCAGGLATALLNSLGTITVLSEAEENGLLDAPDWLTNMGRGVGEPAPESVRASPLLGAGSYQLRSRRSLACNDYADQAAGDSNFAAIFRMVRDMLVSR